MDKGADPTSLDRYGQSLSYNIQKELENYQGTEKGKQKLEQIKQRLITEYHIEFPVSKSRRMGIEQQIQRFENLPQEVKDLYGMDKSAKFIQRVKDSLAIGKTVTGNIIEN